MNRLTAILTAVIIAVLSTASLHAADNAAHILNLAAERFRKAPSISAVYTVSSSAGNVAGNLVVSGQRFRISSPEMSTWFDGTTQWVYSPADREVTVSEPTQEELMQINPFEIINSFRNNYDASTVSTTKSQTVLLLKARNPKAEISRVTLTLDSVTLFPTRIELNGSAGQAVITLGGVKKGASLPVSDFRFNLKTHPGISVNDMR